MTEPRSLSTTSAGSTVSDVVTEAGGGIKVGFVGHRARVVATAVLALSLETSTSIRMLLHAELAPSPLRREAGGARDGARRPDRVVGGEEAQQLFSHSIAGDRP